jgi:hypothetical protein
MLVVETPRWDLEKLKAKTDEDDPGGLLNLCGFPTDDFSLHTPRFHGSPRTKHGPGTGGGQVGMPTSARIRQTCFRAGMSAGGRATRSKVRALALQAAYNAGVGARVLESHLQDVLGRRTGLPGKRPAGRDVPLCMEMLSHTMRRADAFPAWNTLFGTTARAGHGYQAGARPT